MAVTEYKSYHDETMREFEMESIGNLWLHISQMGGLFRALLRAIKKG